MSASVGWRRILVESAAIVGSILLAFVIDAWWDDRKESRRETILLEGLLADFGSSRGGLEERLVLARRMSAGNELLLKRLSGQADGARIDVPDELVIAVLGGPTYEPRTNTLDAAISTGEIELIRNPALRSALANWSRVLADTTEDEVEVRRITNEQVVPLLSRSIDLTTYFERILPWAVEPEDSPGPAGHDAGASGQVVASTELAGALAVRNFYMRFAAQDLQELLGALEEISGLLQEELRPR